jgi:hypothetical protein
VGGVADSYFSKGNTGVDTVLGSIALSHLQLGDDPIVFSEVFFAYILSTLNTVANVIDVPHWSNSSKTESLSTVVCWDKSGFSFVVVPEVIYWGKGLLLLLL